MRVRVKLYGWLRVGVDDHDGLVELTVLDGADVAEVIEALRETSPLLDPRACLTLVSGVSVPLDRILKDGEKSHLYPTFSGG